MLTIQTAGKEILGDTPRNFYIFCGPEYMIKHKYIDHLANLFNATEELDSVSDFIDINRHKNIVSLTTSTLYIVRYDEEFVKNLDIKLKEDLSKSFKNFKGCLILIYSDEKSVKKVDKYFPNNTIRFDFVSSQYIYKYLTSDFPDIDPLYIKFIAAHCNNDYLSGTNMCNQVSNMSKNYNEDVISYMLNIQNNTTEDMFSIAVASKNVRQCIDIIDNYLDNLDYLIICICNVMLELEKSQNSKRNNNFLVKYINKWTYQDIYNMFDNGYEALKELRRNSSYSSYNCILSLVSLLRFSHIPQVGMLYD